LLTPQTIYGHLGKLIQAGTITIQEVMPRDTIEQLTEVFYGYKEESLNSLKEQVGDKFTWDELRLFKASLN
jgi:ABC-type phosphate/phosphonate transport system substrate-binding protein